MTNSRARLRELIERDEIAYLPGVHDALSAKVATADPGVDGVQHSGYGTAASLLGYPDLGFTSLKETTDVVHNVVRAAGDAPVVVDGDTGYGGTAALAHSIPEIEATGAAGVFVEDQASPKQCGLMAGKELVDADRMASKVRAAVDVRSDDEFVVMARSDAYGTHGLDEAVRRSRLYVDAGAEVVVLGDVLPLDDVAAFTDAVDAPFYAFTARTEDDAVDTWQPIGAYEDAGAALVSDIAGPLQASVAAMRSYLEEMRDDGAADTDAVPLNRLSEFLGAREYGEFEDRHRGR